MILLGIGGNLPHPEHGSPLATCEAALAALAARDVRLLRRSRWYESAPVPAGAGPWYVNGVAAVATALAPAPLLAAMHEVEAAFGRVRSGKPAEPRVIDLDLLDYDGRVSAGGGEDHEPVLPHPRLGERAFVLLPLAEVAPDWRHPVSGLSVTELIARLPAGQEARPLAP